MFYNTQACLIMQSSEANLIYNCTFNEKIFVIVLMDSLMSGFGHTSNTHQTQSNISVAKALHCVNNSGYRGDLFAFRNFKNDNE